MKHTAQFVIILSFILCLADIGSSEETSITLPTNDSTSSFNVKNQSGTDVFKVDGSGKITGNGSGLSNEALLARIATLESQVNTLMSILQGLTRNGNNIVFTGVNVQIVNGAGTTDSANGTGNLIVGYNELREVVGDNRTGSHNIVVGRHNNYSSWGGIVVGYYNDISGVYASVSGSYENTASGHFSSVSGGRANTASGYGASVSGGRLNTASGGFSSVSGGLSNTASGNHSSVSGGEHNTASGNYSSVSGGNGASAGGEYNWRAGQERTGVFNYVGTYFSFY
ncbi:MAG TPA: hypothetical protein PK874_03155 [Desulfobacteraceae bacterium]|nr:hypothetical protein [Desulfobacteraceae bacterium]HPJ66275.1 hypothetical protein [Desulfobacteraceae bacterium]